ncbi:MAG: protein kinase domain-containing protein, partial [Planctomycetota bacterium]
MKSAERSRVGRGPSPMGSTRLGEVRRRSFLVPLAAAILLTAVGFWARTHMGNTLREDLRSELKTLLSVASNSVETWLNMHRRTVAVTAGQQPIVGAVADQLAEAGKKDGKLSGTSARALLIEELRPLMESFGYRAFSVVSPRGRIVATWNIDDDPADSEPSPLLGQFIDQAYQETLDRVLQGQAVATPPMLARNPERAAFGPSISIVAPVRAREDQPVMAVLAFAVDPRRFTMRLEKAQMGETGETYAFNEMAQMVSESHFLDDLETIGLLEAGQSSAILNVEIRDPETDLTRGNKAKLPLKSRPLTRMAASALEGARLGERVDGFDVDGYADYRGVQVVGAWRWLDEYHFGIATEIDVAEAFSLQNSVLNVFWILVGLALIGATILFILSRRVAALTAEIDAAQQLGQYTLLGLIGEGAMGKVYKARHALLRRPTAIKVLGAEQADEKRIKRFEREVQLTSRLTHPNTMQIYDYGSTPDGSFYYAMEFLPGTTLDGVVDKTGPQPEARVVHILKQAA